jgi:mycothiol system anti-sigma-R factor
MNHDEATRMLGAYLDGELDLTTSVKLEEHLAGCEACQQKMEAEQELVSLIQTEMPRFEAPPFLKTRIRAEIAEQRREGAPVSLWRRWKILWLASGAVVAALALWLSGVVPAGGVPAVVAEAVANHIRSLEANHLMDVASTDQHTVKPWFAGKLDYSPQVIDLSGAGYPLVGGRLDVMDGRDVAAIVYGRRKHFINLFIWPAGPHTLPSGLHTENGYHTLAWTKSGMNYVAVSEIGEGELHDFAGLIQAGAAQTGPER